MKTKKKRKRNPLTNEIKDVGSDDEEEQQEEQQEEKKYVDKKKEKIKEKYIHLENLKYY